MKVFDFDNTIYDGESSLDFFLYCIKRKKSLIKYMPEVIKKAAKYKAGKISREEVYDFCSKMLSVFLENSQTADEAVKDFWQCNSKKLKKKLLDMINEEDVIISASPRFLLDGVSDKLSAKNIICTEIDEKSGTLAFLCYGQNKAEAFDRAYPGTEIDEFYTDSVNDMPMILKARRAYMVKGNNIKDIREVQNIDKKMRSNVKRIKTAKKIKKEYGK